MEAHDNLAAWRERVRTRELTVGDIMSTALLTCPPETSVADAAERMSTHGNSSILVQDDQGIRGIWTEHDALRHEFGPAEFDRPIREVMSAPVETIAHDTTVSDAAIQFKRQGLRHYLVVDDAGRAAGLISQSDLVINHGVEWFMRLQLVRSALGGEPPIADAQASLAEVARLMNTARQDAMLVYDPDGEPGILTERDVVRYLGQRQADAAAWRVASRPIVKVSRDDSLFQARNLMLQHGFRHLGVADEDGTVATLIGFTTILETIEHGYIEELEQALSERDAALRASEERYRALVELSPDAIAVHRQRRILFINPAGARLLGAATPDEVHGRLFDEFLHTDTERGEAALEDLEHDNTAEPREERFTRLDGRRIDVELTARSITYNEAPALQVVMRDVTRRKELEDELRRMATTDHLTGLCNRQHFEAHLDQAVREAQRYHRPLALIMLDLDDFKTVNDTHGHDAGDGVLQQVVARLQASVRDTDILARWGGEEFMILAPEADEAGASQLAEKLRGVVREVEVEHLGRITASFGLAVHRPGDDRETLIKRVDEAVFAAKHNGRDCVASAQ